VVALIPAVVVTHDFLESASFSEASLCQRPDGSFWRDWYVECDSHNDPRCVTEPGCPDSTPISEGWRHACTWILFDKGVPPSGDEPFYEGPTPGRGCLGQK
jgi:hypothetical protein